VFSHRLRVAILLSQATCLALMFGQTAGAQQEPNPVPAQASTATDQQKPPDSSPAPAPSVWSVGPIDFSGLIDGYYSFNANHPASQNNQLRNFDLKANQFSLNMAKLSLEHLPDPVGFRVDLGFGRAFDLIHSGEQAPEIFRYLEQVYVSLKPKEAKGFEADFGEFVTSAGAEVIETKDNWNYSRSILFSYAIPYYHFGLRTSMPIGKSFTAGFQLVNGWNNIEDNNSGKTIGVTGVFTRPKFTWSNNYYTGPENTGTNSGFRNLYDTTLLLTPSDKLNAYINFDYGHARRVLSGIDRWIGVAGAVRVAPTKWFAITPRAEYYYDATGFTTGTRQKLNEVTVTGEFKMAEGLLTRLEYRRDHSDVPFFDRGQTAAASQNQTTLLVGVVAFFGPKR
jgi:putative OmpL-like beta-barrel porin-2